MRDIATFASLRNASAIATATLASQGTGRYMAAADRHAAKLESRWLRPDGYVMDEFDCYAPSREFAFYLVLDSTFKSFK